MMLARCSYSRRQQNLTKIVAAGSEYQHVRLELNLHHRSAPFNRTNFQLGQRSASSGKERGILSMYFQHRTHPINDDNNVRERF